jgi:hypothetical protein
MDNTAQGVKTIGDLMVLDKFGTLKNYTYENDSPTIEEIDKFESDLKNKSKYFDVEEINNDVISNTKRIKALEQDSKETNDFLYSNIQDSTIGTGLNWKLSNLNKRIEAVETLFNNINEINYINNKTKGDKNETK